MLMAGMERAVRESPPVLSDGLPQLLAQSDAQHASMLRLGTVSGCIDYLRPYQGLHQLAPNQRTTAKHRTSLFSLQNPDPRCRE